jgi:hypothetical protein
MRWLIRNRGAKAKAHIWTGVDTVCHMASTGGLNRSRYSVQDALGSRKICHMCQAVAERDLGKARRGNPNE